MSVKFNDIMKKFYEDEMLGIKTEDAPILSLGVVLIYLLIKRLIKKKRKNYMMEEQKIQDSYQKNRTTSCKEKFHF